MHKFSARRIALIISVLITALIACVVSSCTSTKKDDNGLTKQDRKNLSYVLGKPETRKAAYNGLYAEFPCVNDTTLINTKIQEIFNSRPVPEALQDMDNIVRMGDSITPKIIDHFHTIRGNCKKEILAAFDEGINYSISEYSKQIDTLRNVLKTVTVVDGRLVKTLQQQIDSLKGSNNQLKKDKSDSDEKTKQEHKRGNKFLGYLIAFAVLLVGIGAFKMWRALQPTNSLKLLK